MKASSKLLEHVCERIGQKDYFSEFQLFGNNHPVIKKIPPMGSDCRNVGVEVHYTR